MQPYNADDFVSAEELKQRITDARAMKARLKLPLMQEANAVSREELERFEYLLAKYMYELKAHKRLNRHIDKALELVAKFRNRNRRRTARRPSVTNGNERNLLRTRYCQSYDGISVIRTPYAERK